LAPPIIGRLARPSVVTLSSWGTRLATFRYSNSTFSLLQTSFPPAWFLAREKHPLAAWLANALGQRDAEIQWEGGRYDYFLLCRSPSSANGSLFPFERPLGECGLQNGGPDVQCQGEIDPEGCPVNPTGDAGLRFLESLTSKHRRQT